jgi:hypothetical protein
MGLFLSLSGVIGKTQNEVADSLKKYAISVKGNLEKARITSESANYCVISCTNNNACILYPAYFFDWDSSSEFLSKDLQTTVFSFQIHDEDFWLYTMYNNGNVVDQFLPVPEYFDENTSREESDSWKGNAQIIAKYIPGLEPEDVDKYLHRWDGDDEEQQKAYEDDVYPYGDCWQLMDFMKKVGLVFYLDDNNNNSSQVYRLWTHDLKLQDAEPTKKAWWKFW